MIIGVCGKARAGKDTFGDYLIEEFRKIYDIEFKKTAFAKSIKEMCQDCFDLNYDQLYGDDKESPTVYSKAHSDYFWTPREIMQSVGAFYRTIDYDFWIKRLYKIIDGVDNFIITDVRHVNEAESIRCRDGYLIKIERPELEKIHGMDHESETGLDNYSLSNYDFIINNKGTLEDLKNIAVDTAEAVMIMKKWKKYGGSYDE